MYPVWLSGWFVLSIWLIWFIWLVLCTQLNRTTVSEGERSAVLRFTSHGLPFTVLESGFFSIVSGACYTRAVKRILARTEGHA